jgi:hypothetical protein
VGPLHDGFGLSGIAFEWLYRLEERFGVRVFVDLPKLPGRFGLAFPGIFEDEIE